MTVEEETMDVIYMIGPKHPKHTKHPISIRLRQTHDSHCVLMISLCQLYI